MMCKYMVAYKECGFAGAEVDYVFTKEEAISTAEKKHNLFGFTPEALYEYNPGTKCYDKRIGTFTKATQAAHKPE